MRTRSYDKITENSRRLAQLHQFRADPYFIMLASLGGGGQKAHIAWMSSTLQKFIHRDLRISDDAVKGLKLNYNSFSRRYAPIVKTGLSRNLGDEMDEPEEEQQDEGEEGSAVGMGEVQQEGVLPKKSSVPLNVIYGQHMLSAKAYQSALCRYPPLPN